MEKSSSSGDLSAVRKHFDSLFRYDEEADDMVDIRMDRQAADMIDRCLRLAAWNGHVPIVEFLLEQGARITRDLIETVCRAGRVEVFDAMLRYGWDVNEWQEGRPPLRDALSSVPCTKWLLEHGADPNPRYKGDTWDLLTYVAASESLEIVRLLVEHGANVRGTMAVHAAALSSTIEDDSDQDRVTYALEPSRFEVLRFLLDHGADVNEMEEDPKWRKHRRLRTCFTGTPLHHVVRDGDMRVIEFLLSRGADVMHPSWSGHTPIVAAEVARRPEVVEVLRRHVRPEGQQS